MSRGTLYKLLNNPLCAGRIAHKGETYDGRHPAIIDPETWAAVQAQLDANTRDQAKRTRRTEPSPLTGKLFDEAGERLTPTHAVKAGRRYRYYVSQKLMTGEDEGQGGWRLPAQEIERLIDEAVTALLRDQGTLAQAAREAGLAAERLPDLLTATKRWQGKPLDLIERVDLSADGLTLTVSLVPIIGADTPSLHHSIPMRIKSRGVEMRLVIDGAPSATKADPTLVKAALRAWRWTDDLLSGRAATVTAIAQVEGIGERYVANLLPLAFLAPEIVEAILASRQPVDLTAETLIKRTTLPLAWEEQKALLGFA